MCKLGCHTGPMPKSRHVLKWQKMSNVYLSIKLELFRMSLHEIVQRPFNTVIHGVFQPRVLVAVEVVDESPEKDCCRRCHRETEFDVVPS